MKNPQDFNPGSLVRYRDRQWVVQPSADKQLMLLRPLGGGMADITGVYLPLPFEEKPTSDQFAPPAETDLGDFATARLLYNASRLSFRSGAGPFRSFGKLSVRPRTYQLVPLIMALKQEVKRLLIADDVGIGKTIEALLIVRELLDRGEIERFAVVCLPHLCEQWKAELQEKFGIEAEIIRSGTIGKLERGIVGDDSVFRHYPFQILSIDFIKQEKYAARFVSECPELVVVDEAHTCSRPVGAADSQQQRFHLLHQLAQKPQQHLLMLTATPHSGKQAQFQSLLGLLKPEFEQMDLLNDDYKEKAAVAAHFVQRRRRDVENWLDESTPFPERKASELEYKLSNAYKEFYLKVLQYARGMADKDSPGQAHRKMRYWTALSLLRGVMSSPDCGIEMINNRLLKAEKALQDEAFAWSDAEPGFGEWQIETGEESDLEAQALPDEGPLTNADLEAMEGLKEQLAELADLKHDRKAATTRSLLVKWLKEGYNPIVFCRFIQTAKYLGRLLGDGLRKEFKDLRIEVITSDLNDDQRKEMIADMGQHKKRLIFATDCLSEGINLQEHFTASLHYDLPWNPNRLEQREGRIDRYGQTAPTVQTTLLFGGDNPMDGVVMRVLLEKARQIRKANGITVPFPEDNQSILDAVMNAVLFAPSFEETQLNLDFDTNAAVKEQELIVSNAYNDAVNKELKIRNLFAQNPIVQSLDIEKDLRETDEALGKPETVERLVQDAMRFMGHDMVAKKQGWLLYPPQLPDALAQLLPAGKNLKVTFYSPVAEGYYYLGRNHPFVEQLCHYLLGLAFEEAGEERVARAAVFQSEAVSQRTVIYLLRVRNLIKQKEGKHSFLAEEMLLWGYTGPVAKPQWLTAEAARSLLLEAGVSSDVAHAQQGRFLQQELHNSVQFEDTLNELALQRSEQLVEAHERYRKALKGRQYEVGAVLPMDIMGLYILQPNIKL